MASVLVGISGGLDSAYTAYLLKTRGYNVHGIHFYNRTIKPECEEMIHKIGQFLDIKVEFKDLHNQFDSLLTSVDIEMCHTKTPNICVMCARDIKFGYVSNYAKQLGFNYFATGHYVKIIRVKDEIHIASALDKTRDQSYGFGVIPAENLRIALTPLGDYIKQDIRKHAMELGLPHLVSESHGICFVPPKTTFTQFYKNYTKMGLVKGKFVGTDICHEGQQLYTRGQRVVINNKPYFVDTKTSDGDITVTARENLMTNSVFIKNINWFENIDLTKHYQILIRYNAELTPCYIIEASHDNIVVQTDVPVFAPTSGQVATIYDGDYVVCGGFII
jgi:tRNA-specific 2-thiouridylase